MKEGKRLYRDEEPLSRPTVPKVLEAGGGPPGLCKRQELMWGAATAEAVIDDPQQVTHALQETEYQASKELKQSTADNGVQGPFTPGSQTPIWGLCVWPHRPLNILPIPAYYQANIFILMCNYKDLQQDR